MRPPAPTAFALGVQAMTGVACILTSEQSSDPPGLFLVGMTFLFCVFVTSMCYLVWSYIDP